MKAKPSAIVIKKSRHSRDVSVYVDSARARGRKAVKLQTDPTQLMFAELSARRGRATCSLETSVDVRPGRADGRSILALCVLVAGGIAVAALSAVISMGAVRGNVVELAGASKMAGQSMSPARLVEDFLAPESPEAKAGMTRFPERDLESVRSFYDGRGCVERVNEMRDGGVVVSEEGSFYCFAVALENGMRIVAVTEREDGSLAVDWRCFACESEVEWDAFLKSGGAGEFRVVVARSDYRNFQYMDDKQWSAYRLKVPGCAQVVHGYARVDSGVNAEMELLLGESGRHRFILELKVDAHSVTSGQVEILRCVQSDWIEWE